MRSIVVIALVPLLAASVAIGVLSPLWEAKAMLEDFRRGTGTGEAGART